MTTHGRIPNALQDAPTIQDAPAAPLDTPVIGTSTDLRRGDDPAYADLEIDTTCFRDIDLTRAARLTV
jgi:hypothetical protein